MFKRGELDPVLHAKANKIGCMDLCVPCVHTTKGIPVLKHVSPIVVGK